MYHIVARLELLNLLQRQRHLAASCLVRTQIILMETVEYLVVGKHAEPLVVVDEASMQRLLHGFETNLALLGKDILQAFQLLGTVSQNKQLVVLCQIVLQRSLQQFEILVELGLGRCVERQRRIGRTRRVRTDFHPSEAQKFTAELRTTY